MIKGKIKKLVNSVADTIYPPICPICGNFLKRREKVHLYCRKSVAFIKHHVEKSDGHAYDDGVAVFAHTGRIKKSIYRFKYNNKRDFGKYYAMEMVLQYESLIKSWGVDVIVPVPIHKSKRIKRGFNQTEIIGKHLSKIVNLPYDDKVLKRIRKTKNQKSLSPQERKENLRSAFAVDKERVQKYNRILIVDDIYTTGATIDACARILKENKVSKVFFICVSMGI